MTTITIEEARARLDDLISELRSGEKVLITRNHQPVAELTACPSVRPQPIFGSCKGKLTIHAEDDEHLEDFREYMP